MYITETTENVRDLIEKLEHKKDLPKLKFLIYIFGLLNNNQINDKNEANPNIIDDDNIEIFTFASIGFSENVCTIFLQYLSMVYNILTNSQDSYEDNGNILGVLYDEDDKKMTSKFEKLNFEEKLDVFSEIIIRYDNETYFNERISMLTFDSKFDGYSIANMIKYYKNKLVK